MTDRRKMWISGLAILCALAVVAPAFLPVGTNLNRADVYYAFDIVERFGRVAAQASELNTTEACDNLWLLHSPSFEWPGAPHPFKGRLHSFVEGQRRRAVAEVIAYLRAKTNEDLGSDPEAWLSTYGSESVKQNLRIMKEHSK